MWMSLEKSKQREQDMKWTTWIVEIWVWNRDQGGWPFHWSYHKEIIIIQKWTNSHRFSGGRMWVMMKYLVCSAIVDDKVQVHFSLNASNHEPVESNVW